jgi:integrase
MPRIKLTDALIASSLPTDKVYDLNDTETPGLQCVINPKGKKSFKLRVQNVQKQIGRYPLMKCAEARKIALMWYGELIREGKLEEKKEKPEIQEIRLDDLITEYLGYKQSGTNALMPSTYYDYQWTWKKYISPHLGNIQISQLTDRDVNSYFVTLKETYSHIKTSRIVLKTSLEYAEAMGYNVPVLRPEKWLKFKTNKKERYFTSGELSRLQGIISEAYQKKELWGTRYKQLIALELLMYTGCRCKEILNLQWEDVLFEEGYIQLWKNNTKTKKGRQIPIVPFLSDLLSKIPKIHGEPYVFASVKKSQEPLAYTTLITLWLSLMKIGKFNDRNIERLTIHSLRHTYITVANRTKISPWTIATLVGHTVGNSMTGLYIHHNLDELKDAQEKIIGNLTVCRY